MIPRFKPALLLRRSIVSSTLLALTCLGLASPAAVAAGSSSIRCPETAQAGAKPADSDAATAQAGGGQGAVVQRGSSGFRAYVDPETGELTEPPSDALAEEPPAAAFSTSHEGLVETPSPAPGGGVMVDLQGRFRSPLTATVDADGKVRMQHGP
ncbi:MAG: post-PEP-CTERM-1 domain-containing protein, partial [Planctomycetota bacterium]